MSSTDEKLVQQVMSGDQVALAQVLEIHQQRLYNIVLRMVGDRDDAADITQETMLKIVQHIGDFKGHSQLSTWMIRIAMNLSVSFLRKQARQRTSSLDQPPAGWPEPDDGRPGTLGAVLVDTREPQPDQRVQKQEAIGQVLSALARLDESNRAVLVLRDIDGMDYQQIATVLAAPVGTVKSRLFRARLALRRELAATQETDGVRTPMQGLAQAHEHEQERQR